MSSTLSDDDRRAVDLLMDQRTYHSSASVVGTTNSAHAPALPGVSFDHNSGFGQTASASVVERLGAVEGLLRLLDALPAIDPPADLVNRTMDFIAQASPSRIDRPGATAPGANAQTLA